MSEDLLRRLPTPISAPLQRSREDRAQRKDLQRFCLENTLAMLGAIAVSELLRLYEISLEDDRGGLARELEGDERLKQIGIEQMSLGRWRHLIRETAVALEPHRRRMVVPSILDVVSERGTMALLDRMIETRNRDAHGHPIPSAEMAAELDRRENLLREVLSRFSMFRDWRLVVLDEFSVTSTGTVFKGRDFSGAVSQPVEMCFTGDAPPLREPVIVADGTGWLQLQPLFAFAPLGDGGEEDVVCFSKVIDHAAGKLHYVGLRGSSDLGPADFDRERGTSLAARTQLLQSLYSQPNVAIPRVEVTWTSKARQLEVGSDAITIGVLVRNMRQSVEIREVSLVVQVPPQVRVEDRGGFEPVDASDESLLRLSIDTLEPGGVIAAERATLRVRAVEGGFVRLPAQELTFRHARLADADFDDVSDDQRSEASERGGVLDLAIIDPRSDDPLVPLLRLNRRVVESPEPGRIVLGDRFVVEFELSNVGLAPALEIDLEVFAGTGLQIEGAQRHRFDLDAGERRIVRLPVTATSSGVHEIRCSDVRYQDISGRRRSLACGDEFRILVRDDRRRRIEREIESCVADLYLDGDEQARLSRAIDDLARHVFKHETDPQAAALRFVDSSRLKAVVRRLRATVLADGTANGVAIEERIVTETRPQARLLERAPRRCIAYFAEGFPFFAIDVTESTSISIHFPEVADLERIDGVSRSPLFVTRYVKDSPLIFRMAVEDLVASPARGIGLLKRIVASCRRQVVNDRVPWRQVAELVGVAIEHPLMLKDGSFRVELPESVSDGRGFASVSVLRSANHGASHVCFELRAARTRSSVPREVFGRWIASRHDAEFLDPPHPEPAERSVTERPNRFPSLRIESVSSQRIQSGIADFLAQGRLAFACDVLRSVARIEAARMAGGDVADFIAMMELQVDLLLRMPILIREGTSPIAVEIARRTSSRRRPFDVVASLQTEGEPRIWLNWSEGMPEQGTLVEGMQAADDWGYATSRSLRANLGTWLPVELVVRNFGDFQFLIAAAAAAPESLAGVPPKLRPEVVRRFRQSEPGVDSLLSRVTNERRSRASLLEEAGALGGDARRSMVTLINGLTYQQTRNFRQTPIRVEGIGNDRTLSLRTEWLE